MSDIDYLVVTAGSYDFLAEVVVSDDGKLLDDGTVQRRIHPSLVQRPLEASEMVLVRELLARHVTLTGSPRALVMERADVVDLTNRAGTKPCGQLAVRLRRPVVRLSFFMFWLAINSV